MRPARIAGYIVTVLSLVMATPAIAQQWSAGQSNDTVWFQANAESGAMTRRGPVLTFACGMRAPQNRDQSNSRNNHPVVTDPGVVRIMVNDLAAGANGRPPRRDDIAIVVDGQRFQLPTLHGEGPIMGLFGTLRADAPVVAALKGGYGFRVDSDAGATQQFSLSGSNAAISEMTEACRRTHVARRQAGIAPNGDPLEGSSVSDATETTTRAGAIPDMIMAHARESCEAMGGLVTETGFITEAAIDGDGVPDYVARYNNARCREGLQSFCGSMGCTNSVWLSSSPRPTRYDFQSTSYELELLDRGAGRADVSVVVRCGSQGPSACTRQFRWNGRDFVEIE